MLSDKYLSDHICMDSAVPFFYLQVNIYFSSLSVDHIMREEEFSFMELLAQVGGNLSLFIGITFLSFLELLEFLIRLAFTAATKRTYLKD